MSQRETNGKSLKCIEVHLVYKLKEQSLMKMLFVCYLFMFIGKFNI